MSSSKARSRFLASLAMVSSFLVTLAPAVARAQNAASQTPAESDPPAPRPPLVWGGASLFTVAYLASAAGAATAYTDDAGTYSSRTILWVPAVGPFILMGSVSSAGWDSLLALDGLAQVAGLTLFVYGLATSNHATRAPSATSSEPGLRISVAPFALHGASGAALVGTF
jgi:hypothetical protein